MLPTTPPCRAGAGAATVKAARRSLGSVRIATLAAEPMRRRIPPFLRWIPAWGRGLVMAGLASLAAPVAAMALGALELQSSLGQPLRAELRFQSLNPEEAATLQPRLASPEAHAARGLDYPTDLVGTRFSLATREGSPVLRLEGQRPVREPVLALLLDLRWQGGRLQRAYELLVDPPGWPLAPAVSPQAAGPGVVPPGPAIPAAPAWGASGAGSGGGDWIEPGGLGLLALAKRHAPPGSTPAQMAWALLDANPEAFEEGRLERLRPGQRLRRPDPAAVAAIDPARAARRLALAFPAPAAARASPAPQPAPASSPAAPAPVPTSGLTRPAGSDLPAAVTGGAPAAVPASAPAALPPASVPEVASLAASSPASAPAAASGPVASAPAASPSRSAPGPTASLPRADPESEPWTLGLGGPDLRVLGGLILLLAAGLGLRAWRRRRSGPPAGPTVFTDSALAPATRVPANTAGPASRAVPALGFGLSQLDAGGDIDPLAEADVYLAYGRDLQAEDILRAALREDPSRPAVHRKLLEILAQRHDGRGFAAQARQMQAQAGAAGPDWQAVMALGRGLEPPWQPDPGAPEAAPPGVGSLPPASEAALPSVPVASGGGGAPVPEALDLDLSQPPPGTLPAADWMASRAEAEPLPPLDFDAAPTLPPPQAAGPDPAWARRLALAEEFLRIDDPEGARELLEGQDPPVDPAQAEALQRLRARLA